MLLNIYIIGKFVQPDEAETGSAGEQPVRNNQANVNSSIMNTWLLAYADYSCYYALKNSTCSHFFKRLLCVLR